MSCITTSPHESVRNLIVAYAPFLTVVYILWPAFGGHFLTTLCYSSGSSCRFWLTFTVWCGGIVAAFAMAYISDTFYCDGSMPISFYGSGIAGGMLIVAEIAHGELARREEAEATATTPTTATMAAITTSTTVPPPIEQARQALAVVVREKQQQQQQQQQPQRQQQRQQMQRAEETKRDGAEDDGVPSAPYHELGQMV